jgi:hypothetical protein
MIPPLPLARRTRLGLFTMPPCANFAKFEAKIGGAVR